MLDYNACGWSNRKSPHTSLLAFMSFIDVAVVYRMKDLKECPVQKMALAKHIILSPPVGEGSYRNAMINFGSRNP